MCSECGIFSLVRNGTCMKWQHLWVHDGVFVSSTDRSM